MLDLIVRLVPQDVSDEPASVLLEPTAEKADRPSIPRYRETVIKRRRQLAGLAYYERMSQVFDELIQDLRSHTIQI